MFTGTMFLGLNYNYKTTEDAERLVFLCQLLCLTEFPYHLVLVLYSLLHIFLKNCMLAVEWLFSLQALFRSLTEETASLSSAALN